MGGRSLEDFVKVVELLANAAKSGVECIGTVIGKNVVPDQTDIHEIENETTEKAVFGIGVLFVGHIFGLLAFVFFVFRLVGLAQPAVYGFDQSAAQRYTSFSCRGLGGNEQKEIGENGNATINSVHVGQTSGSNDQRAK
jgi:hypothetical protein